MNKKQKHKKEIVRNCTTHHHACACREQALQQIRSIIGDALSMLIRADTRMDALYGEEKFK